MTTLARAFTTRRHKAAEEPAVPAPYVGRAASQRSPNSKPIKRSEISLPVALISTTNMLSYEAPDIIGAPHHLPHMARNVSSSSAASTSSSTADDSDGSSTSGRSHSTDATSVDDISPVSPDMNNLSFHLKQNIPERVLHSRAASKAHSRTESTVSSHHSWDSPSVPQRAPSHSIKAHVLSHKRSVQRFGGPTSPRQDTFSRSSSEQFNSIHSEVTVAPSTHPFGKELEQLNEAAEEFGSAVRDAEADADRAAILAKGLANFCASDYMQEIAGAYSNAFGEEYPMSQPMIWI